MRLSALQKDLLFVLNDLEGKGREGPIPGVKLLAIINSVRSQPVFATNFRTSCHTLVKNGLLIKFRSNSLQLAFCLSETGRTAGAAIYEQRLEEMRN